MVIVAVADVPGVGNVHDPIHKSQPAAFFLYKGIEVHRVVVSNGVHIHWPAGIGDAGVHVERKDKVLDRISIDYRIEEKRSRGEIDNRRACDAIW